MTAQVVYYTPDTYDDVYGITWTLRPLGCPICLKSIEKSKYECWKCRIIKALILLISVFIIIVCIILIIHQHIHRIDLLNDTIKSYV